MGVILVVSRWYSSPPTLHLAAKNRDNGRYGGVLMGPDRFRVFNNVGRRLLVECGHIVQEEKVSHKKGKAGKRH